MTELKSPYHLPPFSISPPLVNSSNPWASDESQLLALYQCPHTGAVTTRTSLLEAFSQDASKHQHTFFSPQLGHSTITSLHPDSKDKDTHTTAENEEYQDPTSSLNTYGYSPHPFTQYLTWLRKFRDSNLLTGILDPQTGMRKRKPFIISTTGPPSEIHTHLTALLTLQNEPLTLSSRQHEGEGLEVLLEINLSCPNIPGKPPPAYNPPLLLEYLIAIEEAKSSFLATRAKEKGDDAILHDIHIGLKNPPFTYTTQFTSLLSLPGFSKNISFITAVNTLGGCLLLSSLGQNALGSENGWGIGGMAGSALHPIALGNVRTLRRLLDSDEDEGLKNIKIVG
ncbi:hypothetical protein HYALB_00011218, partial [Hymenoscyphus albidus]